MQHCSSRPQCFCEIPMMATHASFIKEARKRIFFTVFPVSAYASTQPTPLTSPETRFTGPGQPFGGHSNEPTSRLVDPSLAHVADDVRWDRAWHLATSFLSLSGVHIPVQDNHEGGRALPQRWGAETPPREKQAMQYVLRPAPSLQEQVEEVYDGRLLDWYMNEIRRHFVIEARPLLLSVCALVQCLHPAYRLH